MRTSVLILALVGSFASAASAQTAQEGRSQTVISGEAPNACVITGSPAASGQNAAFSAGGGSGQVRIVQLVDPLTAQVLPTTISVALPVVCNAGHAVIVRTSRGGLVREGAVAPLAPGFRNQVPYDMAVSWDGSASTQSSTSSGVTINRPGPAAGSVQLNITIPAGGDPLVAGAYSDQVVIELRVAS
ncbi:hypothetical protein [Brevundimonas sp. Root1423]|uniref:hypothetical protein n=1 Tax=Brevundimonas sp. Root1423 TaxID=1736462 RepID=UPI0006F4EF41|nr:hypothetical protein [Brevundimonas sp. Root1423]KQY75383.1 hypothetical protein ASD25_12675 [Brevundimonas sp. Root1423]